jgi:hypothetical protein
MGTSTPTFKQMDKIHSLLTDHDIDAGTCQVRLLESGLLADLACAIGTGRLPDRYAFRKALGLEPTAADFKIWRTVKLGTGMQGVDSFAQALVKFDLCYAEEEILRAAIRSATIHTQEIDLVRVTLSDLGMWSGDYPAICKRALAIGLKLCPAEVGLQLRLQYTDQPRGEMLLLGMEPFAKDGTPSPKPGLSNRYIFVVGKNNGYLANENGDLITASVESYAGPVWKFVFVRPRK